MRRKGFPLLVMLGIIGLAVAGCYPGASPLAYPVSAAPPASASSGINVQGEGSVKVKPDTAMVRLGVQLEVDTAERAQREAATRMNAVMEKLTAIGVPKDSIKTVAFSLSPRYASAPNVLTGYWISSLVAFKLREVEKVGAILDAAMTAGANSVQQVAFTMYDPEPIKSQARELAMADARRKAEQLARLAGVRLGKATQISENMSFPGPVMRGMYEVPYAALTTTPISPGEMEVQVRVQVVYNIE